MGFQPPRAHTGHITGSFLRGAGEGEVAGAPPVLPPPPVARSPQEAASDVTPPRYGVTGAVPHGYCSPPRGGGEDSITQRPPRGRRRRRRHSARHGGAGGPGRRAVREGGREGCPGARRHDLHGGAAGRCEAVRAVRGIRRGGGGGAAEGAAGR